MNHVFPPAPKVSPVGCFVILIFAAGAGVGTGVGVGVGTGVETGVGTGVGAGVAAGVGSAVTTGAAVGSAFGAVSGSTEQAQNTNNSAAVINKAIHFFIFDFLVIQSSSFLRPSPRSIAALYKAPCFGICFLTAAYYGGCLFTYYSYLFILRQV